MHQSLNLLMFIYETAKILYLNIHVKIESKTIIFTYTVYFISNILS